MSVSRAASMPAPGGAPAGAMRMFAQLRTALAARPVTAAGIAAVYRYRDPDDVRGDLDGLRAAGLIDPAGDGASEAMTQLPEGPMRAAIEAETNRRAGVPYAILSVDERVALLAGLAALPG